MSPVHIILADYDAARRTTIAEAAVCRGVVVHQCSDRIEALGKYWILFSEGVIPRAVVASWLMDTPESRSFFSLIGREVDHTSLSLFRNASQLDPEGILACYTDRPAETLQELSGEGLAGLVQVLDLELVRLEDILHHICLTAPGRAAECSATSDAYPAIAARLSR